MAPFSQIRIRILMRQSFPLTHLARNLRCAVPMTLLTVPLQLPHLDGERGRRGTGQ
jgi:hypothetical protein